MLCIPEQLFKSAHTAECKGLFMWPGLFIYVYWLSAYALLYLFKLDKPAYSCSILPTSVGRGGGGTLNVEMMCMLVGNFFENSKKYPDFDFKHLKNTQIAGVIL